jgi:hypothetical protein
VAPAASLPSPALNQPLASSLQALRAAHAARAGGAAAAGVRASNGAIADALVISLGTAKKHVNNIVGKLDVCSRLEAALWAREHGLI